MKKRALLLLAALLTVTACSGFGAKIGRRLGGKVSYQVELDPRLNQDFPLAVDFVIVYDQDLYGELSKLDSSDWFAQRDQFRLDHEPERLEVHSNEWVPPGSGSQPKPPAQVVEHRLGARGGVVFADYYNPGTHRILIEPLGAVYLRLGETSMELGEPPDETGRRR